MAAGERKDDQYKKTGILGDNGTGKSTWLLSQIEKSYDPRIHRVLIICDTTPKAYKHITRLKDYEDMRRFKSGIALFFDHSCAPEQMLENIIDILREGQQNRDDKFPPETHYLHNGAIIFEDCSNYIMANPKQCIRTFLGNYRMYQLDLFFIAHTLTDFPSFLRRRMNYYVIYKTLESLSDKSLERLKYPNHQNIYRAWVHVMNQSDRFKNMIIKTGLS